jgi:hypothetical protein
LQRAAVLDHVAIRGVHDATVSGSDRASVAVSVAAGAATPAGRSPAGTLARLGDGNAGSAAEPGPNLLPLDPIVRPNIASPSGFCTSLPPNWRGRGLKETSKRRKGSADATAT